jgi:hypothetical protein
VKLPELPAGSYSISASSDSNTPQVGAVDVCMITCRENLFEVTEFAFDSLHGPIYAIDRRALAISEISIEIAPDRAPGFVDAVARAEQQPVAFTLREFSGVVIDPTGAVIPGASVTIVRKGNQLVSALTTNGAGEFSAQLDPGDYYILVAAQGFSSQALHVAIAPQGSPDKAQFRLNIGEAQRFDALDTDFSRRWLLLEDRHYFVNELVEGHRAGIAGAAHEIGCYVRRDEFQNLDIRCPELVTERKRVRVDGGLGGAVGGCEG